MMGCKMKQTIKAAKNHMDKIVLACMFGTAGMILVNFPRIVVYAATGN